MLKKIRLTNFKSFVDEEVELAPLTLLVGANASGKSNFLDAIRFLQGLSLDLPITTVLGGQERISPDAWPGIRGRIEEAARRGESSFSVETLWSKRAADGLENGELFRHQIRCLTQPLSAIKQESVFWGKDWELDLHATDRFRSMLGVSGDYDWFSPGSYGPLALNILLSGTRFLEINPAEMRDYGRRDASFGNEGSNFSGVLATLCDDPSTKQSLVDWIREVCAPEIEDLDFAEVKELGDVMAIFVERGGIRISARSISDGTLQFLGTLLALRTAEPGDIFLIEEIEHGLHPTRIRLLVELLEAAVRERQIQVIATTHSPAVLQWLAPERLQEAIVFGRVPDHEGTIMRRLGDLPYFDEVVQRTGIEELFTTGWLEMAL